MNMRDDDFSDPWADWKPVWGAKEARRSKTAATPHDFQECHAPTAAVDVCDGGKERARRLRRRILDARLWETLPLPQQDAALEIERAYTLMTRPLGYRLSNPAGLRVDGMTAAPVEWIAQVQKGYVDWARDCHKAGLLHAAVLDILIFGQSCRQVDRARRMRNGWARDNLGEALALWCRRRGWPER